MLIWDPSYKLDSCQYFQVQSNLIIRTNLWSLPKVQNQSMTDGHTFEVCLYKKSAVKAASHYSSANNSR